MSNMRQQLEERYGKGHLSYSSLKQALTDTALFDMYMKGMIKSKSAALDFGTLYDMLLFERDKAMETYVILNNDKILSECSDKTKDSKKPEMTNEYKAVKKKLQEEVEAQGRMVCSQADWQQANDMIDRLDKAGLIDMYMSGDYQVEFNEDLDGVPVKGFLDCLGNGYITDSKSTKSVEKFRYSVRDFSYDIQAYIYTKVFGVDKFYWLVQEKTFPYTPALVTCSENTIFAGEMKFHTAVDRIKALLDKGADYNPAVEYVSFTV